MHLNATLLYPNTERGSQLCVQRHLGDADTTRHGNGDHGDHRSDLGHR